jgi:hypothetical protein
MGVLTGLREGAANGFIGKWRRKGMVTVPFSNFPYFFPLKWVVSVYRLKYIY